MKHNWILNASPLILLGKSGLLSTISPLAECWLIPENVVREVSRKSSIDAILAELSENAQVYRQKVTEIDPFVASWNLGAGGSEE